MGILGMLTCRMKPCSFTYCLKGYYHLAQWFHHHDVMTHSRGVTLIMGCTCNPLFKNSFFTCRSIMST